MRIVNCWHTVFESSLSSLLLTKITYVMLICASLTHKTAAASAENRKHYLFPWRTTSTIMPKQLDQNTLDMYTVVLATATPTLSAISGKRVPIGEQLGLLDAKQTLKLKHVTI